MLLKLSQRNYIEKKFFFREIPRIAKQKENFFSLDAHPFLTYCGMFVDAGSSPHVARWVFQ